MEVDHSIYKFIHVGFRSEIPRLKDWEAIGIPRNSEQNTKIYAKITGREVKIIAYTSVSAALIQNNNNVVGTFYCYENESKFLIDGEIEITPAIVAELILHHLGITSFLIIDHSTGIHPQNVSFGITIFGFATHLLWVEETWNDIQ